MRLEALEFLERREVRVLVVEVHDEADRHQIVVEVIEERAAAGALVERPAEACAAPGPAGACPAATCHSSLSPMPNFCGSRPSPRPKRGSAAWRASRARLRRSACICRAAPCRAEAGLGLAVPADAHVAGGDADDRARSRRGAPRPRQSPDRSRRRAPPPCSPSQRQTSPSETMKLPWLRISGGIRKFGSRSAPGGRARRSGRR